MNDWKLTTEIVRTGHVTGPESAERFDRWIAEVERAAAEKAWDEGARAANGWHAFSAKERTDLGVTVHNPYRKEQ